MSMKRTTKKAATKKTTRKPAKKTTPAKTAPKRAPKAKERDPRLPAVGSTLTREFKGKKISVKVTAEGFQYEGQTFKSISACARHIVGYMISGPIFFRLVDPKPTAKKEA